MAPTSHWSAASASTCGAPEAKSMKVLVNGALASQPAFSAYHSGMPCRQGCALVRISGLFAACAARGEKAATPPMTLDRMTPVRRMARAVARRFFMCDLAVAVP